MAFIASMVLVFLRVSTPPELSQATLAIMFVALGIILMGIGFARLSKTKENLRQHRWFLTVAVALTLGTVFLVMIPSGFSFFIDPSLQFLNSLTIETLAHSAVGATAIITALIYVFGDLPRNVKRWMRITAALWIAALVLGVFRFLLALSPL